MKHMTKDELRALIEVASGRKKADVVLKGCRIADVYSGSFIEGDIALSGSYIAGIGEYEGEEELDARGKIALPGFIDSHIHIESAYVSPHELGRLLVPHGGTTIIADPHEIVNVCGIPGLDYMMAAAEFTALDIKYMLPSCVPATPWEHSGAVIDAPAMGEPIERENVLGLGEFMNFPGIIFNDESVIDKIMVAKEAGKLIDGHSPGVAGKELNAYVCAGVHNDHECDTVAEMHDRIACGMYVMLREGSACHNLRTLAQGVTRENARRCLLCSDDRQPRTILELGHLDNSLRMCIEEGIDAMDAIRMASLNAAECFGLSDRGAISPGLRADIVLVDNLHDFTVDEVFIAGRLVAKQGNYLLDTQSYPIDAVKSSMHVANFSKERLRMQIASDEVYAIELVPGGVVTKKTKVHINRDALGDFIYKPDVDLVKIAVVERHHETGNVALGLLKGYGMQAGAIAISIAHDSHNIIAVGTNDDDMAQAVETLIAQEGGMVLVRDGVLIEAMPMPIAGLMSDQSGEWVDEKLQSIHHKAHECLGITPSIEPTMTLSFLSLAVIPEIKLTDMGLFDVTTFDFMSLEA